MATTVSILPSSWSTTVNDSNWKITISNTQCGVTGSYIYDCLYYGKAYFALDVTSYSSISLTYTNYYNSGIAGITFGVFSNTTSTSNSGTCKVISSTSGTITLDTSSLTGTKYIGFYLTGNGYRNDYG